MIGALLTVFAQSTPLVATATARWELEAGLDTRSIAVGELFDAMLVVQHPAGARASFVDGVLDQDSSWLTGSAPRITADSTGETTRWSWELASLEPGQRDLPKFEIALVFPDGRSERVEFATTQMNFAGVLGENEDAPRAALEFRPALPEDAATPSMWIALAGALLAAAAVGVWWWKSRRRGIPAPAPSALDRVRELETRDLENAEVVRVLHYELTALLRAECDARAQSSRTALTDDEWFAAVEPTVPSAVASALRDVFAASRAVKYGFAHPTHWAVRETLQHAALALTKFDEVERSAA